MRNPQGIGVGGFRSAAESGTAAVGTEVLYHAHEMYVQIGLDLGWLGLAGFLTLLLYVAVFRALKAWSDRAFSVRIAFIAALSGTAVQGLNDYFFAEAGWMILFGIVLLGSLAKDYDRARTEPGMSLLRSSTTS